MHLKVGYVYYVKFSEAADANFSTMNGVYSISKIFTYDEAILSGVDVYESIYLPLGIPREKYTGVFRGFEDHPIYELHKPNDVTTKYYVPQSLFLTTPDPNVKKLPSVGLTANFDLLFDITSLDTLADLLNQAVKNVLGVDVGLTVLHKDDVYLTQAEYDAELQKRQAYKDASDDIFTKHSKLIKEHQCLQVHSDALEQALLALNGTSS